MQRQQALGLYCALCVASTLAILRRGVDERRSDMQRARTLEKHDAQMRDLLMYYC